MSQALFHSLRLETPERFERYRAGIQSLLACYQPVLLDDFSLPSKEANPESATDLSGWLTENTRSCLPWVWVLHDTGQNLYALAALSQVIPGRHAYLHGVSHPEWPTPQDSPRQRQAVLTRFAQTVLKDAFHTGGFQKIKAEFEADNQGARGFCLRMGFSREACFKQDNRIRGQWRDVAVYSLFRKGFMEQL